MFKKARFKELLIAQFEAKPGQELSWQFIVGMCNQFGIAPAGRQNWLTVRGALQEVINAGIVRRTADLYVEHYVKVG